LNGRFLILLRRRQNQVEGSDVVVMCNPVTGYGEYVPGTVDNETPFDTVAPEDGWYDFTNYIEDVEKISLSWDKTNTSDTTTTSKDGSNYDKGITSELMFFDLAFQFVFEWLVSSECGILNAVEVKIVDLIAGGEYRIFEIKSDNLDWAPFDEPCIFHIKLREQDSTWHCIHKTFIHDNWQHWFENSEVKEHPCFLTCIEPRPRLVSSARMALLLFLHSNPVVNLIDAITSNSLLDDARNILNANRFVDAPLVRTYIENVALKCGLSMDTIFDVGEEWENLCLYYPQAGFMHENNDDTVLSPSLAYHYDNRWLITVAELMDKLKEVFAAEWYVTPNNTIVFKHTKDLVNLAPIYDFTDDDAVPFYDLRYTFNGDKKSAYGRYEYQPDGSDLASQEVSTLYNDIIDYDGPANNPMLEGEKTKNFQFAPTGFIRDGRSKDYLELLVRDGKIGASILLAALFVIVAALGAGVVSGGAAAALVGFAAAWKLGINGKSNNMLDEFTGGTYSGAVRLTSEQTLTPRLILWDGINKARAKAFADAVLPVPNPYYNPDLVAYDVRNKIDIDNPGNVVYNYPLYFDGDFTGNLYDRYHETIDNPLKSLETHQEAKWNVDLCEDMLNLFGVFQGQYAQIGKIVKLEERSNYDVFVRLGNINVDYDNNKISLKGTVIRRATTPVVDIACGTFQINENCLVVNGNFININ
jgi:hypothetical protein